MKGLLVRFACHQRVPDLDEAMMLFLRIEKEISFVHELWMVSSEEEQCPDMVRFALSLVDEYRQSIDKPNLDTAIAVANEALASYHGVTNNRVRLSLRVGNALVLRYLSCGDEDDLSSARASLGDAKQALRAGDAELHVARADLRHLGLVTFMECGLLEGLDGLREAVRCHGKALAEDREAREACRRGTELMEGDITAIEESISQFSLSLSLRPPHHPRRGDTLAHYAIALYKRFCCTGRLKDLDQCIATHEEALAFFPLDDPHRPYYLVNRATALSMRFEHKGNFKDLDQSIALNKEVLNHLAHGHPSRCDLLTNLAGTLCNRFEEKGDSQDLEECIALGEEALALFPPDDPLRACSLNNLARALTSRFHTKGDLKDLEVCIALHNEALSLRPPGHPNRISSLHNLANALFARFNGAGDFRDLEQCIALYREALSLLPPGHPGRSTSLNNLAYALGIRYQKTRNLSDLLQCILHQREQFDISFPLPEGQQGYNRALGNHTEGLKAVIGFVQSLTEWNKLLGGDMEIKEAIFEVLETGAHIPGASPIIRLVYARLWAFICRVFHRPRTALEAYHHAISSLPVLASLDLTLEQRQNVLVHSKDLSKDAVQCAIEKNELDTALVFLSTARSVFWSQALQFRGSLDRLYALHPDLASEFLSVTRQLQIATEQQPRPESTPSGSTPPLRPYLLSQQRDEIIAKIRAMEGFRDFMLPPSPDVLKAAARKGPIVFLNASEYGCHALILKEDGTLHPLELLADTKLLEGWVATVRRVPGRSVRSDGEDYFEDCSEELDRACRPVRTIRGRTTDDEFRGVLGELWANVGQPVISALGFEKTSNPRRIWWCPTGLFTFLPIHAAGIYPVSPSSNSDCLSDYVVSSYCSAPQDLLAPSPGPTPDFKMLVAIEPDGRQFGAANLPATRQELEKIKLHVPQKDSLITRIGSEGGSGKSILDDINAASIVHFGCHGKQNPLNPLDSSLLLSERRLTMSSLIRDCQTSTAALAYLSACETAMGDDQRPDESLTLAATMQFAGFRSVVATMWSIHDHDAPIVADAFYRHLFRHGTTAPPDITDAAYALHLATQELRQLGRSFHRWVPFVHHGI
ncbi:hypothetical protein CC2G_012638 [Coprinopsis cinerea AmutBmut pab1-1]|nr:hypothetical protein CC2G_012638 [Coprinopsis cinerea AmutBmut pab1-1]